MAGLWPYSGSQVMSGSPAMRDPTKKPSSEPSRLNRNLGKPWETLPTVGPIPRYLKRADSVACLCLTTGQDFLGVHLHWIGLAADEACPLCGHARMDSDHLLQCTGIDEYPTDDVFRR
ncbi:reverse transcriptase [Trichonephila clavipes]|nr:reverse transcriptase [Trichonephila clavipes]